MNIDIIEMIWCKIMWCGVVWYDVIWYDVILCDVIWCDIIRAAIICHDGWDVMMSQGKWYIDISFDNIDIAYNLYYHPQESFPILFTFASLWHLWSTWLFRSEPDTKWTVIDNVLYKYPDLFGPFLLQMALQWWCATSFLW